MTQAVSSAGSYLGPVVVWPEGHVSAHQRVLHRRVIHAQLHDPHCGLACDPWAEMRDGLVLDDSVTFAILGVVRGFFSK